MFDVMAAPVESEVLARSPGDMESLALFVAPGGRAPGTPVGEVLRAEGGARYSLSGLDSSAPTEELGQKYDLLSPRLRVALRRVVNLGPSPSRAYA